MTPSEAEARELRDREREIIRDLRSQDMGPLGQDAANLIEKLHRELNSALASQDRPAPVDEATEIERDAILLGLAEVRAAYDDGDSDAASIDAAIQYIRRPTVRLESFVDGAASLVGDYVEQKFGVAVRKSDMDQLARRLLTHPTLAASPPSPDGLTITDEAVAAAMQEAWDDICSDTGCHPLDIKQLGRKRLSFSPGHWARATAMFLRQALSDPEPGHG